jgi:acetolactate synthase small subunit
METINIILTANNAEDLILRITAELHKRGFEIKSFMYNVDSYDMAEIGITAVGEMSKKEQILRQLYRLYDIKQADLKAC